MGVWGEKELYLILNALRDLGPVTVARIREALGAEFSQILDWTEKQLWELQGIYGVGPAVIQSLCEWRTQFDWQKEYARMERLGVQFIACCDPQYPKALTNLQDAPLGLYWRGNMPGDTCSVAIIGTRDSTSYGDRVARALAQELVRNGIVVISGLARGIDTAAHWGAVESGGMTLAVLGHGIDQLYPAENRDLRDRILENGAVVSEFPLGRRPDRRAFPMRNRLVSGLADAVVIVETDLRGGSMITANFAGEQGKPVFAVPGNLGQKNSRGCHALIREGVTLLTSVDDILEQLNTLGSFQLSDSDSHELIQVDQVAASSQAIDWGMDLGEDGQFLFSQWRQGARWTLDQWVEKCGWPAARLQSALLVLELQGVVRKAADGSYERV